MTSTPWSWKGHRPATGWRAMLSLRVPWAHLDWHVVLLAGVLVGTGLVFVRAVAEADFVYGRPGASFAAHLKKLVVACPFLVLGFVLRPRWLRRRAFWLYAGAMVLLVLVPFVGEERNHARRWIPMPFGFDLQPSELAKPALVLALAAALYRSRLRTLSEWAKLAALALLPMALVVAQPDLGTALTIVPVTLGMAWLAGGSGRVLLSLVGAGVVLGGLAYQLEWVESYQKQRVDTWLASFDSDDLIAERNGAAFHSYHAHVTIGNGGWRGTGLGAGVANEAGHLPERESDSIFAVVAEEGGLVGAGALVFVYALFAAVLLLEAGGLRERFARLVVGGVGLYFAAHFFIHAGVNLGLLPMTGLTLPLVSTGGSSLLASFLALGLALGVSARAEPTLDRDAFGG